MQTLNTTHKRPAQAAISAGQSPLDAIQAHDQAMATIHNNIWHQNPLDASVTSAVQFLIELLQSETTQSKDEILLLLAYLARGNSYSDRDQCSAHQASDQTSSTEHILQESDWLEKVQAAIASGLQVYLNLLASEEPAVRTSAAYLLASIKEHAYDILPALHTSINQETDQLAQSSMLLALAALADGNPAWQTFLADIITTRTDALVRLTAAMALAKLANNTTLPEVICILVSAFIEPAAVEDLYLELPWAGSSLTDDIGSILYTPGSQAAKIAIPALIQTLKTPLSRGSLRIVDALLHLAFNGQQISTDIDNQALTAEQRLVLTAIASSNHAWVIDIIKKNAGLLAHCQQQ